MQISVYIGKDFCPLQSFFSAPIFHAHPSNSSQVLNFNKKQDSVILKTNALFKKLFVQEFYIA